MLLICLSSVAGRYATRWFFLLQLDAHLHCGTNGLGAQVLIATFAGKARNRRETVEMDGARAGGSGFERQVVEAGGHTGTLIERFDASNRWHLSRAGSIERGSVGNGLSRAGDYRDRSTARLALSENSRLRQSLRRRDGTWRQ